MAKKPAAKKPPAKKPAEEKAEEKPAEKKEVKPKEVKPKAVKPKAVKKKSATKSFEDSLAKMGYMDAYDYLTLIAGAWGIIWTIINFFDPNVQLAIQLGIGLGIGNTLFNIAWAIIFLFIIQLWIFVSVALFPFIIDYLGMKLLEKWPESFPLHFIKSKEDFRSFMIFLAWWSTLIFWLAAPLTIYPYGWPYFISFVILAIVIFADALRKRIKKMPEKKIRE
jgi:hypothetical protein